MQRIIRNTVHRHNALTVKLESLASTNTRVAIQEEFEVAVRVFDGADFILIVDKVSVYIISLETSGREKEYSISFQRGEEK